MFSKRSSTPSRRCRAGRSRARRTDLAQVPRADPAGLKNQGILRAGRGGGTSSGRHQPWPDRPDAQWPACPGSLCQLDGVYGLPRLPKRGSLRGPPGDEGVRDATAKVLDVTSVASLCKQTADVTRLISATDNFPGSASRRSRSRRGGASFSPTNGWVFVTISSGSGLDRRARRAARPRPETPRPTQPETPEAAADAAPSGCSGSRSPA